MTNFTAFLRHIKYASIIRKLLDNYTSDNIDNLYWYDMSLQQAVSWSGIFKVLWWQLLRRDVDAVSSNYGLSSLYYADTSSGLNTSHPAGVWNCLSLSSQPGYTEPDTVRALLKDNAEVVKSEFAAIASRI